MNDAQVVALCVDLIVIKLFLVYIALKIQRLTTAEGG